MSLKVTVRFFCLSNHELHVAISPSYSDTPPFFGPTHPPPPKKLSQTQWWKGRARKREREQGGEFITHEDWQKPITESMPTYKLFLTSMITFYGIPPNELKIHLKLYIVNSQSHPMIHNLFLSQYLALLIYLKPSLDSIWISILTDSYIFKSTNNFQLCFYHVTLSFG